jgi:hypothetical protein
MEVWKNIEGYEGIYQVSNLGRVKSLERKRLGFKKAPTIVNERILKTGVQTNGYLIVGLHKDGKVKTRLIHQLVAIAFLNHKPDGFKLVVNHINFNRSDNRFENLEIVTHRENSNQKHLKSTSKYTGVSWCNTCKKWVSSISINNKKKTLGRFTNEHDAHLAYENKLKELL